MRIKDDEFWFSLSDSDIGLYLQGVNADKRFNVDRLKLMLAQFKYKDQIKSFNERFNWRSS